MNDFENYLEEKIKREEERESGTLMGVANGNQNLII